jgi:hypothetical protein
VCVCVGVALNTFFFLVSSFILSPTGKTLAGRLPTGYITLLKRRAIDVVGFTWHCYFLSPHNCLKLWRGTRRTEGESRALANVVTHASLSETHTHRHTHSNWAVCCNRKRDWNESHPFHWASEKQLATPTLFNTRTSRLAGEAPLSLQSQRQINLRLPLTLSCIYPACSLT